MAELKTKKNKEGVVKFLKSITDKDKRANSLALLKIFKEATKMKPVMWGSAMVGFGEVRYKYASGREGDWMLAAFSPRKAAFSLYLWGCMGGFEKYKDLFDKLGKYSTGKGCLYIKRLSDVNIEVLKKIIKASLVSK